MSANEGQADKLLKGKQQKQRTTNTQIHTVGGAVAVAWTALSTLHSCRRTSKRPRRILALVLALVLFLSVFWKRAGVSTVGMVGC